MIFSRWETVLFYFTAFGELKMSKINSFIVASKLYPYALKIRSLISYFLINLFGRLRQNKRGTVYCISPYKSGTTFFSQIFICKSRHEPFMHLTINKIDNSKFIKRRHDFLDLDLECSGFFAHNLKSLRSACPNARVIYLVRHPETWIRSVLNYFYNLNEKVSYNYVARLVFDPICKYPVDEFYQLSVREQSFIVTRLLEYWINVYKEAYQDSKCMVMDLKNVEKNRIKVERFTGLKMGSQEGVWKRENSSKREFLLKEYIDVSKYREQVLSLGYQI